MVTLPSTSPEAVLDLVRAREEAVHSLRARFASDTASSDGHRRADGVLLVRKPDRFRMRLLMPFGLTVFDFLADGERVWITLPMGAGDDPSASTAPQLFSRQDIGETFLRGRWALPGDCQPQWAEPGIVEVTCRDAVDGQVLRLLRLDAALGVIVEETSFTSDAPRLAIRYGDFRHTDGTLLPHSIAMRAPARGLSVDITVQRYEVNPALADDLFTPPANARSQP